MVSVRVLGGIPRSRGWTRSKPRFETLEGSLMYADSCPTSYQRFAWPTGLNVWRICVTRLSGGITILDRHTFLHRTSRGQKIRVTIITRSQP
jgi:hypothetical protein